MATQSKSRSSAKGKSAGGRKKGTATRASSPKPVQSRSAKRTKPSGKTASARPGRSARGARKATQALNSSLGSSSSRASASKAKREGGGRGRANPEFMKPMRIKEPLTRIVGNEPLPRTEVTKRVWDYIKQHKLQDEVNRRQINADENLRELFGRDSVTMFEMTKIISQFLA